MYPSIDKVASRQHGVITHEQLKGLVSEGSIRAMLKAGKLIKVHKGVYRTFGSPTSPRAEALAAVLATAHGALASLQTALLLYGFLTSSNSVHVSVASGQCNAHVGIKVHRSAIPLCKTTIDDIPITTVERTIVDAATFMNLTNLGRLMDNAVVTGKTSYKRINDEVLTLPKRGRKGARVLRQLMKERAGTDDGTESVLEQRFLRTVKKLGLPMPQTQFKVRHPEGYFFIDAAWPERRVAIELDGFSAHGNSKKRFDDDRRRQNFLQTETWDVYRFTARMKDAEIKTMLRRIFAN